MDPDRRQAGGRVYFDGYQASADIKASLTPVNTKSGWEGSVSFGQGIMAFSSSLFSGLSSGVFSGLGAQQQQPRPQDRIVSVDLSVLATPVSPASPQSSQSLQNSPAIIPPWQLPDHGNDSLNRRINELRGIDSFIDTQAPGVDAVGVGPDARATFILFDALSKLQTLAQFAAESTTPQASLADLEAQFQRGLSEVRDFIVSAETENLTLLSGARTSAITAPVTLGEDDRSFVGRSVATASRDDPLPGLAGDETFTVSITKSGTTTDIAVDLSQIQGTVSINAVVDLVNAEIAAIPATDANGDPLLDANGDPIPKFSSRFEVVSDDNFDHAIEVRASLFESVRLSSSVPEPSLAVASNLSEITGDTPTTSLLRQFSDAGGAITALRRTDISAVDTDATTIAELGGEEETDVSALLSEEEETTVDPESSDVASVPAATEAQAVAVDSQGFIYTVGRTAGDFESERNQQAGDGQDVFLRKLDTNGNVVFSRLLGSASDSNAFSIAVDAEDNVIVAGQTTDNVADGARLAGADAFVSKFSPRGEELFTRQLDTVADTSAASVTTDANGDILITGAARGSISATVTGSGGNDVLALRLDGTTGAQTDAALFGTAGDERGAAVAVASDGNILVASQEDGRAILRKLDATDLSNVLFEQDLGDIGAAGDIAGLKVAGGELLIAGSTRNAAFTGGAASVTNAAAGERDGFLLKLTDQGASATAEFLTHIGTAAFESIDDIAIGGDDIFLGGRTRGDLAGAGRIGSSDGFVARLDLASGAIEEIEQFGRILGNTTVGGLAVLEESSPVLEALGLPLGALERVEPRDLETQTTAQTGDFFEISVDGARARRIEVAEGDDLEDIAAKINRVSFSGEIEAEVILGELTIRALGDAQIDLVAGSGERDLLSKLGLEPQRIVGPQGLFDLEDNEKPQRPSRRQEPEIGGAFAFKLDQPLSLANKQAAKFTLEQITAAVETSKRAFRSLTPNPLTQQERITGDVPPRLRSQIANYTDALNRLQAFGLGGGGFSI